MENIAKRKKEDVPWYEMDPKIVLYGIPKMEKWTPFVPKFKAILVRRFSRFQRSAVQPRVSFTNEKDGYNQGLSSKSCPDFSAMDSGIVSPTNDDEHFPSLEDRARTSSRMFAKSGRATSPTHSAAGSLIRASIVKLQNEKRAKKVRFYRNGDRFFKGMVYAVSPERFRTFESLLGELTTSAVGDKTVLPNGVRHMFTLDGSLKVTSMDELEEGESYVCASTNMFKQIDYPRTNTPVWNPNVRSTDSPTRELRSPSPYHDMTQFLEESREFIKPKLVTIIRNGSKPRKAVRILLNKKTAHSFDQVLTDITDSIKLDSGTVKKVFTIDGRPVTRLEDFFGDENVFLAYGNERQVVDDFDLRNNEVRFVSAYKTTRQRERITLKSPRMSRRVLASVDNQYNGYNPKPQTTQYNRSPVAVRKAYRSPTRTNVMHFKGEPVPPDLHAPPPKLTHKYKIGKLIGEGNFATVRECLDKNKRKHYALKIIDKLKCKGKEHMIENELNILRKIRHQNIVQLIEDYENHHELFLVMELIKGGDLFDAIAETTKYTERDASGMLFNLASALKYLHNINVVHRDIKPENLMVYDHEDGRKSVKLGDFGLATECNGPLYTVCGTPTYVAPEIVAEQGYGKKVDVWSAGVITYILLCGFPPFVSATNDQDELFDRIMDGYFRYPSPYWDDISESAKELISGMLEKDPEKRMSAAEVLDHPWVATDDTAREQDLNITLSKAIRKPRKFKGTPQAALLAATPLDKGSRYFEGRGQIPLQSPPYQSNEVF